ncbi:hypothetical protein AB0B12_37890 [Streptomyces sp. NPDC044780]|uniref:hypothetical protein n=1 Tax=unclassified Streptomyces TaxID=2593676 RepID=UPI0033DA975A
MSVSAPEVPARFRKSRTRSRTINASPALAISTLKPHQYDLRPACASLICPDCKTWVPITGIQAKIQKLVPHDAGTAGEDESIRCKGSNRRVDVDVAFEAWWQRLEDGVAETDGRRSNRVTRKPQAAVAPAVTQIVAPLLDAKAALKLYRAHRQGCPVCKQVGHTRCTEGGRLAHLYLHKVRTEPARRAAFTLREKWGERRERGLWMLRELQWASTVAAVRRADIQRVRHALEATLWQHSPELTAWERADLMSAINMLATKVEQLSR